MIGPMKTGASAYEIGDIVIAETWDRKERKWKPRPCLVIGVFEVDGIFDYNICFFSTQDIADPFKRRVESADFVWGGLNKPSFIRPTGIFTSPDYAIKKCVGHVARDLMDYVYDCIATAMGGNLMRIKE